MSLPLPQRVSVLLRNALRSPMTILAVAVVVSLGTAASFRGAPPPPATSPALAPSAAPFVVAARPRPALRLVRGLASWYGEMFENRPTASGAIFDGTQLTAAHRFLPFGSLVRVTNLRNKRSVVVTITDRGALPEGRVIDLSYAAASQLNMIDTGLSRVSLEVLPRHRRSSEQD